jgi:hypothetical protein
LDVLPGVVLEQKMTEVASEQIKGKLAELKTALEEGHHDISAALSNERNFFF